MSADRNQWCRSESTRKWLLWIEARQVPIVWAIGLLAFALRSVLVVHSADSGHYIHFDTTKYVENAQSMLHTGLPTLNRAPIGFSYLLMPFLVLGMSLKGIGFVVEPLVGALVCVAAYGLCRSMGFRIAGVFAAFVCAIHPALINGSTQILTEDWTCLCILLSLILAQSRRRQSLILAGLLMGYACAIRSPSLGMLLGLALWWVLREGRTGLRHAGLLLLGAAIPILVVSVHLSIAAHKPVFLTLQNREANWLKPVFGGYASIPDEEKPERTSYLQFAAKHPASFLYDRMVSFVTFASPWPLDEERSLPRKLAILASDGSILLVVAFSVMVWWRRGRHREWFELLWLPACLCAFYTLLFSIPRYRLPTIPLLIVFCALVLVPNFANVTPKSLKTP